MRYIDSRLSRQIRDARPDLLLDAIFIVVGQHQDPQETWDDNGLAEQILHQVIAQTNEQPVWIRLIPRANAVALTASSRLIDSLLDHPSVQIASAVTVDLLLF